MSRLVVLSNRIPTDAEPSGGLVVALHEALSDRGGIWIGSSGDPVPGDEPGPLQEIASDRYTRLAFDLTEREYEGFYLGHANSVLWPLFHHRSDLMVVEGDNQQVYQSTNQRVATLIANTLRDDDVLWVHDYHFLPMAWELRRLGVECRIGFFLHIPFPTASDIPALPDRKYLPDWLAAYDLVGLQTSRDVSAAIDYLRHEGCELTLQGRMKRGDRTFRIRFFPIGIDVDRFAEAADAAEAGDDIPLKLAPGNRLIIGVDRLDYSKGLPQRFEGFGRYLRTRGDDDPRATLLQIAPPSREDVEAYQDIRRDLEGWAGSVNGAYAELDWTPIRYIRRSIPRELLAGLYRMADVGLVTPLADGMNLVAKEYVAAQKGEDPGVLVLSHFAGAAEQMDGAVMVNPYDGDDMARGIRDALSMDLHERQARHLAMMEVLRRHDIGWWTQTYLDALTSQA